MKAWVDHNLHSLGLATKRMGESPFAALFSILVIGIALSLPAGLYVALKNAERLAGGVPTQPEITLFLDMDLSQDKGNQLAQQVAGMQGVAHARFVSRDDGLKHLKDAGLSDLTAGLSENPLPDAIVVTTKDTDADSMERLAQQFKPLPGVDHLAMDTDWARRLTALLDFGHNLVWLMTGLLGLALAAITGNTIRLQIYAARDEIEVSRLIGATNRFIRRPFLYFGVLQGFLGGLAGWLIVTGGLHGLAGSLERLALAWGGHLDLLGLGPTEGLLLLTVSSLLGFLGAFLAVNHSLRRMT
ncbi:MAG: permease-like cell division protein FtsX [Parasulfuritortus sp.]|nr:permease-like cell division protein FtsX [Parasulfuritortus sp.]